MTVLAWDGKTLAADRLACAGHLKATVTKILRFEKELLGICGNLATGKELKKWYLNGAETDNFPAAALEDGDTELVVIKENGRVWVYAASAVPFEIEDEVCAFGAGGEAAWAAMLCGASAEQAVSVASQVNITCGNGMDILPLIEKEKKKKKKKGIKKGVH